MCISMIENVETLMCVCLSVFVCAHIEKSV